MCDSFMKQEREKRKNTRTSFEVPAIIEAEQQGKSRIISGTLVNVSLKGLYIKSKTRLPAGTLCTVLVALAGPGNSPQLVLEGVVARDDGKGMGIRIVYADTGSLIHLKQLMSFNTSNPDLIEEELLRWNK